MPYNILSLDGGGLRGVLQAVILGQIETLLGKRMHQQFSLIAGTSTGSILACCLAIDKRPAELEALYLADGPEIFKPRAVFKSGLFLPKYPADNIERVLQDHLGGERLSDTLVDILVPAADYIARKSVFMTSREFRNDPSKKYEDDLLLWRVARRSSAAPVYFPMAEGRYQDGGVFSNDPSIFAITEALSWGVKLEDIRLLSIGTGAIVPGKRSDLGEQGALGILPHIGNIFMDAGADAVDYTCRQLLGEHYVRIQPDLTGCSPHMDDCRMSNMQALRSAGLKAIASSAASTLVYDLLRN